MTRFDPATDHAIAAVPPAGSPRPSTAIRLVLAVVALLALAGPLAAVLLAPRRSPPPPAIAKVIKRDRQVVPKAELPPVEPIEVLEVTPEDARAINAAISFSRDPNPAARPFRIVGAAADQARAVDCLASAVYYEAGDDAVGQRAVAQVVLNRVRHPAFPQSVCAVVYQGQERVTGCQFTFTCDGALARYVPSPSAWKRAREVARLALNGSVYKPVGHATHYHTDWVVPYWSSSLDKIVAVDTHLFFRWTGWWGTPPAFNRRYAGAEPNEAKLSRLSTVHVGGETEDEAGAVGDDAAGGEPGAARGLGGTDSFIVALDRHASPDAFFALAVRTCGDRPYCKFMGWTDEDDLPGTLPLSPKAMASMSFSFLRDREQGFVKALWNCEEFPRGDSAQCMRQPATGARSNPAGPRAQTVDEILKRTRPANLDVPVELNGVRRRPGREWVPLSSPTDAPTPIASPTAPAKRGP